MTMQKQSSNVLTIAIMFALFFMIAFVTGLQNPFGVIVKEQFGATNFQSQLGNLANFLAYLVMGIPSGILLSRIGYRKTAIVAVIVGLVGVATTYFSGMAANYAVYLIGAFISGFSMCLLNTVVNPMLNGLGKNQKQGNQLIQFGGSINSIAATITPILVGALMGSSRTISAANPALYIAMGVFALAFIVLIFSRNMPEPHLEKKAEIKVKDKHSAWSFRHFILGIIAIFIYVGVEVGIPNISNLFMTDGLGMDTAVAGTIVGTYWFLMLCGRLLGGIFGGKVSSRAMLTTMTFLGAVLVLLAIMMQNSSVMVSLPVFKSDISFGLTNVNISIMFLILCGLCTSIMWGSIFNLATAGLGKYTAMASGIFMMMVVGGGVLPAIQGWIADIAGYMSSYWVVFGGMVYMLIYGLWGYRNVNTDINTR